MTSHHKSGTNFTSSAHGGALRVEDDQPVGFFEIFLGDYIAV
jgi:hypothetical protein